VGATVSLALAAVDIALWDLRCKRTCAPLHLVAGGAQRRIPIYNTEGGWLNFTTEELVDHAVEAREAGFRGFKVKVGQPHVAEDVARLAAVRRELGPDFEIMVDANQCFTVSEAIRRAKAFEEFDLAWFEEPMPAEDIDGHVRLSQSTSLPIAVGESLYHPSHFREYLQRGGCSIVQVDVARIGGITPWLKTAHLAETFNMQVCPHYLMEIHVALCAAVPNSAWVEFIPQLDVVTESRIRNCRRLRRPFLRHRPGHFMGLEGDRTYANRTSHQFAGDIAKLKQPPVAGSGLIIRPSVTALSPRMRPIKHDAFAGVAVTPRANRYP
jgi:L-alanine-DL-glutamate epimerase-like enolase superfamily enzyme